MPTADIDVGPWQRILSASIGALITSFLVTPLDVTKIRMQVQNTTICDGFICEICEDGTKKYNAQPIEAKNVKIKLNVTSNGNPGGLHRGTRTTAVSLAKLNQNYYLLSNGLMDHQLPTSRLRIEVFESKCLHTPFRHSWDAFYKIARYEGVSHLYTGLSLTLWMAVPATVLYYSTYDLLRNNLLKWTADTQHTLSGSIATFMPLISGSCGRLFAATVISPLELMRTQMMARTIDKDMTIWKGLSVNFKNGGFWSLWKGLIPTLWRDVPFSGIYWMSYEYNKDRIIRRNLDMNQITYNNDSIPRWRLFMASFLSGALSGGIATLCTQPFDVLKTRRQASLLGIPVNTLDVNKTKLVALAKSIVRNEGVTALFLGLPARITRVPISCAIMVSTYEIGKIVLKSDTT
eukprot:65430_1